MLWSVYKQTAEGVECLVRLSADTALEAFKLAKEKFPLAPFRESLWVRRADRDLPDLTKRYGAVMPSFRTLVKQDIVVSHCQKVASK